MSPSAASISPKSDSTSSSGSDSDHDTAISHNKYQVHHPPKHSLDRKKHDTTTSRDILLFLIAFRILNALSIKTFFQPDEFFQSLEPAWDWAFGANSGAWITWEWKNQLRSAVHPAIFAGVYWLSSCLSNGLGLAPDAHADLLIAAPKVTQAVFAALGDYYTWKLAERVYGRGSNEAWATLAVTACSPWQWFCSTRTLSNCLETTLTIAALSLWPWQWSLHGDEADDGDEGRGRGNSSTAFTRDVQRLRGSLLLAAVACVLRPTNILIWICITYFALFGSASASTSRAPFRLTDLMIWSSVPSLDLLSVTQRRRKTLVREIFRNGSTVLLLSALIDRLYYQQWTFPPLRFLYYNLAQSVAVFYGRNVWHYYISQGFPLLLTTLLPFALVGLYQGVILHPSTNPTSSTKNSPPIPTPTPLSKTTTTIILNQLYLTTLLVPFILSFISHKELRFIYPLLPSLHIISAPPLTQFFLPTFSPSPSPSFPIPTPSPKRLLLLSLLSINTFLALLTTTSHQPAPLSVLTFLRTQHTTHYLLSQPPPNNKNIIIAPAPTTMTVGFLMPCHSTPWRSHLVHPGIKAWALSCEPPLHLPNIPEVRESYVDEADRFYEDPRGFVKEVLGPVPVHPSSSSSSSASSYAASAKGESDAKFWPEYLVFFAQLEDTLHDVMASAGQGHIKPYHECWRGWNSWAHDDWRRRGDVVVWCLR